MFTEQPRPVRRAGPGSAATKASTSVDLGGVGPAAGASGRRYGSGDGGAAGAGRMQGADAGSNDGDRDGQHATTAPSGPARSARRLRPRDHPGRGDGEEVTRIRGDRDDVFSHGFICPKGSTLKQLHEDPDRLRRPLVKRDGRFVEVELGRGVRRGRGRACSRCSSARRDAAAPSTSATPTPTTSARSLFLRPLLKALGTPNLFSAITVDQRPKEISSALMFGGGLTVPVPDIDRTDHLLMLGANPYASNGSLATAPDWPGRIEALLERGGRLVVVDPRRSRTAEAARSGCRSAPAPMPSC